MKKVILFNAALFVLVTILLYRLFPFPGLGFVVYLIVQTLIVGIVSFIQQFLQNKFTNHFFNRSVFIVLSLIIPISCTYAFPQDAGPSPKAYFSTIRQLKKKYPNEINYSDIYFQEETADGRVIKTAAIYKYQKKIPGSAVVFYLIDNNLREDNQYIELRRNKISTSKHIRVLNETSEVVTLEYFGRLTKNKIEFSCN
ncbi:MAG: hypothetical protein H0X46_07920, partial [Bacteroidetes bacterium]|nr:hypothetical protein [Bacteroidota bacterium]